MCYEVVEAIYTPPGGPCLTFRPVPPRSRLGRELDLFFPTWSGRKSLSLRPRSRSCPSLSESSKEDDIISFFAIPAINAIAGTAYAMKYPSSCSLCAHLPPVLVEDTRTEDDGRSKASKVQGGHRVCWLWGCSMKSRTMCYFIVCNHHIRVMVSEASFAFRQPGGATQR
jgi:hypothetical protein